MGGIALCLMLMVAACGSAGSNEEEDDSTFPEPPGRPGTVQVDSATVSSTTVSNTTVSSTDHAVPVDATMPAVVSDLRRSY
jgi:hypothetical protein